MIVKTARYEIQLIGHNGLPHPKTIQKVLTKYCCCGVTIKRITPIKEVKEGNPVGVV